MATMSPETATLVQTLATSNADAVQICGALQHKYTVYVLFMPVDDHTDAKQVEVKPGTALREKLRNAAEDASKYYLEQIGNALEASK